MIYFWLMLIKEAYQQLVHDLQTMYDSRESSQIADMVLSSITGLTRTQRLVQHDAVLNNDQEVMFNQQLKELKHGKPIQYVIGNCWFQDMLFKVDERVLIPRPETEELVELIIREMNQCKWPVEKQCGIIDIGTGSGCIAISLKKAMSFCEVWAIDKSSAAIFLAKENAELLNASIHFKEADILSEAKNDGLPAFHIIVSNPPYILPEESIDLRKNVIDHEPKQALFVTNADPLQFYKAILEFSSNHLLRGGLIFFETHENHATAVKNLLESNEFEKVEIKKDLQGKDRIVWGKRMGASL
jgi:release factor glutamine methyltransferase